MINYEDFDYEYDDDEVMASFIAFRSEAMKFTADRDVKLVEDFCAKIGYSYPLGYFNHRSNRTFELFTNRPGVLIGRAGRNIELLKDMLKEEFKVPYDVKLVEIRGGFANIKN
jgi:hypothetical protein